MKGYLPLDGTTKKYIPIDIPTKKYIRGYLLHHYNNHVYLNSETTIGSKLLDILQHSMNEEKYQFSTKYDATVRIHISRHVFEHRGAYLNHSSIKAFNRYIEKYIKERFFFHMDFACNIFPSFEAHIDSVRLDLGISEDDWSYESMKKTYYRYRKQKGNKLFSKKSLPYVSPQSLAF